MKTWKLLLAAMMALVMLFAVTALAEDGVEANSLFPHKHYYGEWDVTKDATCTEAGVKTRECRWPLCEHKETCEIPAKGHDFGEWTVRKMALRPAPAAGATRPRRGPFRRLATPIPLGRL